MKRLRGSIVSEGMARGEALVVRTGEVSVPRSYVVESQVEREVHKFSRAVDATRKDIEVLQEETREQLGEMSAIISTYLGYLNDGPGLLEPIRKLIRSERYTATYGVFVRFGEVARELQGMPEPLPSRVPDLIDIKQRILSHLRGGGRGAGMLENLRRKVIIIADDLTPTQTASLDRTKVLGFATDRGGPASHTAILARHMGIPAIVGLDNATSLVRSGDPVLLDGMSGTLIVDPQSDEIKAYQTFSRRLLARRKKVHLDQEDARTRDGTPITILGNIDRGEQANALRELGVQGVGLFRTEFLFLGRQVPTEADQQAHYERLLAAMAPHPVSIRTMDFGADKWDHRVGGDREPNPFLGMRAIRLSFAHEELFRTQLRAVLRASGKYPGQARLMFPMVADVGEFKRARDLVDSVKAELREHGQAFDEELPVGAMVEQPSAALTSRNLVREAAFVSLGTNDLTQYTLAVDRTNPLVADLFTPHHPAVLKLIQQTVEAADEVGRSVSACGEMAGMPEYTPVVIGLGLRSLSMAARRVPLVVPEIRRLNVDACRKLVQSMVEADDASHAQRLLSGFQRGGTRRRSPRST